MQSASPYATLTPGSALTSSSYGSRAGGLEYAPYSNPFYDVSSTYMPTNIKQTFHWCEYLFMMDPLVHAALTKMAAYPITDLEYHSDSEKVNELYKEIFDQSLKIQEHLVGCNQDFFTYGNSFTSIYYPLRKQLTCPDCSHQVFADRIVTSWVNYSFRYNCPKCKSWVKGRVKDKYIPSRESIRLVRWNPRYMDIAYNPATGHSSYTYTPDPQLANGITLGKPEYVLTTPQVFIEAVKKGRKVNFFPNSIFHMKRIGISRTDSGWGVPSVSSVLKYAFYYRVLQKAQEAIALEHIVPARVIFPQLVSRTSDPTTALNLREWTEHVQTQLAHWRKDNNHIMTIPYPLGYQTIGGQGKALLVHNDLKMAAEFILVGLGCPPEFVFGGMNWSGSNVSLRTMENMFLDLQRGSARLVDFVSKGVRAFLRIPYNEISFKEFKMADDLQRAAFDLQLANARYISKATMLQGRDYNYKTEREKIRAELEEERDIQEQAAVQQAEAQGEAGLVSATYQIEQQDLLREAQMAAQQGQMQQMPQQGQMQQGPQQIPQQGYQQAPPTSVEVQQLPLQQTPQQTVGYGELPRYTSEADSQKVGQARDIARYLITFNPAERQKQLSDLRMNQPELYPMIMQHLTSMQVERVGGSPEVLPSRSATPQV